MSVDYIAGSRILSSLSQKESDKEGYIGPGPFLSGNDDL
jgi:hypothetical protein